MKRIKCNNVPYRKGYIEIDPEIHENFINMETWKINADFDIYSLDIREPSFPDDAIEANTEIELSVNEAEQLIVLLQNAIAKVKK